jgi:TonB family protein
MSRLASLLVGALISYGLFTQTTQAAKVKCSSPKIIYREKDPLSPSGRSVSATLVITIDEEGHVGDVRVSSSSGDKKFDQEASESVKNWRFKPVLCEGKPKAVEVGIEMSSR